MDPLGAFMHAIGPIETILSILELLPARSLRSVANESHSRRIHNLASRVLWRHCVVLEPDHIYEFIQAIGVPSSICDYGASVESLIIGSTNAFGSFRTRDPN